MIVFLNGKFLDARNAKVSIFDHGFMYGDGVFERLRTYRGKIWNSRDHIQRLFQSAKLMHMHIPWKPKQMERWILQTIKKNGFSESGIRVELTRGEAEHNLKYDFLSKRKPTLLIVVISLRPWPPDFYKKGIRVITFPLERSFPEVKTTSLIVSTLAQQAATLRKADEAILIDCFGRVTECTSANVFFVKNGKLLVPQARVLPGTTAKVVVPCAKKAGIPVIQKVIKKSDIALMDECFLTSVTRGIMPVAAIDGKSFKQKTPGRITVTLMEKFQDKIDRFIHGSS